MLIFAAKFDKASWSAPKFFGILKTFGPPPPPPPRSEKWIDAADWCRCWTAQEQGRYPEEGHSVVSFTCFVCHSAQHRSICFLEAVGSALSHGSLLSCHTVCWGEVFPGLKPACSWIRCSSVIGPSLFRISLSKSLKRWHKREIGL